MSNSSIPTVVPTTPFAKSRSRFGLFVLLASSAALAAPKPDLSVTYLPPSLTLVDSLGTYSVRVSNIGNRNADGVELVIQMPKTGTSPQVFIMGDLQPGYGPSCFPGGASGTPEGTTIECGLGTIRRGRSATVTFTIALPEKTGPLTFTSSATTITTPENNPDNNINIVHTATLDYYENTFTFDGLGQAAYENKHCTGTGLTAYFECEKFPSSISSHPSVFHDNGTISLPGQPDYTGAWSLSGDRLTFTYTHIPSGLVEAEFSGRGVATTGCWEGLTRFPDGTGGYGVYVSPYRVCPQ